MERERWLPVEIPQIVKVSGDVMCGCVHFVFGESLVQWGVRCNNHCIVCGVGFSVFLHPGPGH